MEWEVWAKLAASCNPTPRPYSSEVLDPLRIHKGSIKTAESTPSFQILAYPLASSFKFPAPNRPHVFLPCGSWGCVQARVWMNKQLVRVKKPETQVHLAVWLQKPNRASTRVVGKSLGSGVRQTCQSLTSSVIIGRLNNTFPLNILKCKVTTTITIVSNVLSVMSQAYFEEPYI